MKLGAKGMLLGHDTVYEEVSGRWLWADTLEAAWDNARPCVRCGRVPTKEGHDSCLGALNGAIGACCGHGREQPSIVIEHEIHGDEEYRGEKAIIFIEQQRLGWVEKHDSEGLPLLFVPGIEHKPACDV